MTELGQLHPEWRLGQLLGNLAMSAGRTEASGVWDLEDSEALAAAQRLLERRHQQVLSKSMMRCGVGFGAKQ
jgi:hypothetical protein